MFKTYGATGTLPRLALLLPSPMVAETLETKHEKGLMFIHISLAVQRGLQAGVKQAAARRV